VAKVTGRTDGLIPEAIGRCKFFPTTIPSDPKKVSPPTFRLDPLSGEMKDLKAFVKHAMRKPSDQIATEWVNSYQVMSLLKIKKVTLQKLRNEKTLPCSHINGKIYYKLADVEALLKSNYR
jgi:hypothetical protein